MPLKKLRPHPPSCQTSQTGCPSHEQNYSCPCRHWPPLSPMPVPNSLALCKGHLLEGPQPLSLVWQPFSALVWAVVGVRLLLLQLLVQQQMLLMLQLLGLSLLVLLLALLPLVCVPLLLLRLPRLLGLAAMTMKRKMTWRTALERRKMQECLLEEVLVARRVSPWHGRLTSRLPVDAQCPDQGLAIVAPLSSSQWSQKCSCKCGNAFASS
mmetsp:Transcript_424/g.826  ORF Transcript_424/g.826 Transcript_424/m.826 type:complete len:210 (-) Transcript_424:1218-1847(-)